MDIFDIAGMIGGGAERRSQSEYAGRTRTYSGTALSNSSNGKVTVALDGDTVAQDGSNGISMQTVLSVRKGQAVTVTVVNGTPTVTGIIGWGDAVKGDMDEITVTVEGLDGEMDSIRTEVSGISDTVDGVSARQSALEQDVNGFKTTVSNTYETKSDAARDYATKSELSSSIQQSATSIQTSVAQTYETKSAAQTQYNSLSTQITQTASSVRVDLMSSSEQLWYSKSNSTAPAKPTARVTNSTDQAGHWTRVVPTYNASYPYYFYCYQQKMGNDSYQWTDVMLDKAASNAQSTANTANTKATNAQTAANSASSAAASAASAAADAAKTATNYLEFSSSGLCVGDMSASTLGRNINISSSNIDLRNGSTILARFAAKLIELGRNATDAIIRFCGGKGRVRYDSASTMMALYGENGAMISVGNADDSALTNFIAVDASGNGMFAVNKCFMDTLCNSNTYQYTLRANRGMYAYRNQFGVVTVYSDGSYSFPAGSQWDSAGLGTLPAGWRPAANVMQCFQLGGGLAYLQVGTDGAVQIVRAEAGNAGGMYVCITFSAVNPNAV